MKVGLIRVVTLSDQAELHRHGALIEAAFPGLEVVSKCIEDQPKGIYDEESEKIAEPKVIQSAKRLEEEVKAVIISCAADPGVKALKGLLKIPVIGAGESLAAVSRALGHSIGVITIGDRVPEPIKKGLGDHYRAMAHVDGIKTALDLQGQDIATRTLQCARILKEQGCDVLALGCTGFSSIGIAQYLSERLSMPVVDPVLACGAIAYNLLLTGG